MPPPSPALYAERADATPQALAPQPPLLSSLRLQGRVIWALLLREILTRFGRRNLGFLWLFLEPVLFVAALTAVFSAMRVSRFTDISIPAFLLTGYGSILLWRNMASRSINAMQPNIPLLYHHQVRPLDIYFARMGLDAAAVTVSFIILAFTFHHFQLANAPHDILQVLIGWFLMTWFGASLGLLLGPFSERSDVVGKLWSPLSIVMMIASGAFFLLETFPPEARSVLLWFPPISCLEYLREGYFGHAHTFYYDLGYVVVFNALLTIFGLAQVRYISRHVTFG